MKILLKELVLIKAGIGRLLDKFGDLYESFYASMESVFENAVKMLNANPEFISAYRKRMISIVDSSTDGWGHKDSLSDILEKLDTTEQKNEPKK